MVSMFYEACSKQVYPKETIMMNQTSGWEWCFHQRSLQWTMEQAQTLGSGSCVYQLVMTKAGKINGDTMLRGVLHIAF